MYYWFFLTLENGKFRTSYVCSEDAAFWQQTLLQMGLNLESEEHRSVNCRVRALKVFVAITDVDEVQERTNLTYDEFM